MLGGADHPMIKPIPPATLQHVLPPNLDYAYFQDGGRHPFRHDAAGFALVNAWWLAEASLLTYADDDFATRQFRDAGWTVDADQPIAGASTLCYVVHSPDAVIVAFRGTRAYKPGAAPPTLATFRDILRDYCTDGRVDLIDGERQGCGGAVHRGFDVALDQIWEDRLIPCLQRLCTERPSRTVWFTGHSLGAALATLAAARFDARLGLRGVPRLYTFGSPLVGDRGFAERFGTPAFRFVNNCDVVPLVPRVGPCSRPPLVRAYEHVGELKYVASDGTLQDSPSRWARVTDGVKGRAGHLINLAGQLKTGWEWELVDDGFNDHAPLFYALRVWNAYAASLPR